MIKIKQSLYGLIASRKGLLALIGLVTIQVFLCITLILFLTDWVLEANLITFEFVKDIFVAGFQWDSGIIAAYAAANISQKIIEKKNGKR